MALRYGRLVAMSTREAAIRKMRRMVPALAFSRLLWIYSAPKPMMASICRMMFT